MKILNTVVIMSLTFMSHGLFAGDEDAKGVERVGDGVVKTVTSPGQIVEGIVEETEDKDAVGVVTGSVVGSAKAAEQAVEGAADMATGVIETILNPLTGNDD